MMVHQNKTPHHQSYLLQDIDTFKVRALLSSIDDIGTNFLIFSNICLFVLTIGHRIQLKQNLDAPLLGLPQQLSYRNKKWGLTTFLLQGGVDAVCRMLFICGSMFSTCPCLSFTVVDSKRVLRLSHYFRPPNPNPNPTLDPYYFRPPDPYLNPTLDPYLPHTHYAALTRKRSIKSTQNRKFPNFNFSIFCGFFFFSWTL